ncbi:response regulator transcription factor (plasmid) [Rhizobium leguminosarum]|uniref:response regulator transcription factor n=1 Tax=Rhizobium leguminosarum TaxID=384 RepID=UPI001441E159|nr:response regulator transcription factor [Rhizobium leguminosarum]MBY5838809.1 response regulator transcription factor [Rhizobium leguminosarum]NKM77861.1 response regulator [Rhizobium leguminosarum bv. viciae]QSZ12643.1 response regulator transcription factor [Rhizobium leguminosarum]
MSRVLLVEDDERIVGFIKRGLEAEGYLVDLAGNGEDALAMVRETPYSLIILDRVLPGIDGLEVCRMLRREQREHLILMLTARDSLQDKVEGLKGGADDYLTKPFAFDELIARMEALLRRRPSAATSPVLKVGDLLLDPTSKKVWRGEREIGLTAKEFRLLTYLMSHPGTVVSRTRLLNNVWDLSFDPETKVVDVYIRYLRRKIESESEAPLIKTVRGFGYVISP